MFPFDYSKLSCKAAKIIVSTRHRPQVQIHIRRTRNGHELLYCEKDTTLANSAVHFFPKYLVQ